MSKRPRGKFIPMMRPRVVVSLPNVSPQLMQTIVELGREWDWDLLDYSLVDGEFPTDPAPTGAMINTLWDMPLAQQLHQLGCKMVRLGIRENLHDHLLPVVLPNLAAAGILAARHFLERNFTNLACVVWCADQMHSDIYMYTHMACKTAQEHGMSVQIYEMKKWHVNYESPADRFERSKREIGGWLQSLPKPLALITYSDIMAAKLCVICRRIGLHVPEEVAILGMGNTTWCERTPVELSSIMQSEAERATKAMHLLRDLMEGKPPPAEPIMVAPIGIRQRRSTDMLAVDDLVVAKSLRFLWEHAKENIGVQDAAGDVGLSNRQLERRFLQATGCTVNQQLVKRRLEAVKRLLRTTAISVMDIAPMTGFRSSRHLHHSFRRNVGITPMQFRNGIQPPASAG